MLSLFVLAALRQGNIQSDDRLAKVITLREELISLDDLGAKLKQATGAQIFIKRRVGDRKVTINFTNRPAREAMAKLATCMGMQWQPSSGGYVLDLTPNDANAETRTETFEREIEKRGVRDAFDRVRRYCAMTPDDRLKAAEGVDKEYAQLAKSGEPVDSYRMQLLREAVAAFHAGNFLEVLAPAWSRATTDKDGLPIGSTWVSSSDPNDGVGVIDPADIHTGPNPKLTDVLAIVTYSATKHEIQAQLLGRSPTSGMNAYTGAWRIPRSSAAEPSALEREMKEWVRPLSSETLAKGVSAPTKETPDSGFTRAMLHRGRQLLDLSDRSRIPIVADAFREPFTACVWLGGPTVKDWLAAYDEAAKSKYRRQPDYVREDEGWLLFRHDHWWHTLKAEIPESLLAPLERKALSGASPLTLEDYSSFTASLSPEQFDSVNSQDPPLLRFPTGSLEGASRSLVLLGMCDPAGRAAAFQPQGLDLSAAPPRAKELVFDGLISLYAVYANFEAIRNLVRAKGIPAGYRFIAEDEINKERDYTKIGGGRDIHVEFSFGRANEQTTMHQTFTCSKQ